MKNKILFLAFLLLMSCSSKRLVSTGYMAFISKGRQIEWEKFKTTTEVDSFIIKETQIEINSAELLGNKLPYFECMNGDVSIYVEKKGVYEKKNGKLVWKVYDDYYEK